LSRDGSTLTGFTGTSKKINEDSKDQVLGVTASTVTGSSIAAAISRTEPRFYVYKHQAKNSMSSALVIWLQSTQLTHAAAVFVCVCVSLSLSVLIYCCPAASARPLRMVYSTAKGSVADQCTEVGIAIAKSYEVTEPAEVNDALFRETPVASTGYASVCSACNARHSTSHADNRNCTSSSRLFRHRNNHHGPIEEAVAVVVLVLLAIPHEPPDH
jgi:hypothetical protein